MEVKFIHKISKGSRFNQIYVPKQMENVFEVGDIVEVKIIEKNFKLHYSKSLKQLTPFKVNIIKKIFSSLNMFKEITQIFVIGSFLTKNIDYNDVDILVILNDQFTDEKVLEKNIYDTLEKNFQLKYHIIMIKENNLLNLSKKCPLTRSMLYYFISNKNYELTQEKIYDNNHLKYLLMMPEDILEINVNSRVMFDNLRRLVTIEKFLDNASLNPLNIDKDTEKVLGNFLSQYLRNNEQIDDKLKSKVRDIIKLKLINIKNKMKKLKDGQKRKNY